MVTKHCGSLPEIQHTFELKKMTILVTGAAGFTGGNLVLDCLACADEPVVSLDKLPYAGNLQTLTSVHGHSGHIVVPGDVGDRTFVEQLLAQHQSRAGLNFAAGRHVDRSVSGLGDFIQTNIVGTFSLLESVRGYWAALAQTSKDAFRFSHVSTDEAYRTLGKDAPALAKNGYGQFCLIC